MCIRVGVVSWNEPRQSRQYRVGLTDREDAHLRRLSRETGVPLARMIADAVRAHCLKKTSFGGAAGDER